MLACAFLRWRFTTTLNLTLYPAELLGYGSESVCNLVEKLEGMLKAHYTFATTVSLNRLAGYKEKALKQDNPAEAVRLTHQAQETVELLGTGLDLDVRELRALCDEVLEAAKKDLRGK